MENNRVEYELRIVAKLGESVFEGNILNGDDTKGICINGCRVINYFDLHQAMKRFILRNCGDPEILAATVETDFDKKDLAYNPNLTPEMAIALAEEFYDMGEFGIYPYELCAILRNPSLPNDKLDFYAKLFLEQYQFGLDANGGKPNYEALYILRYIAKNPLVSDSTLELLRENQII